MARTKLIDRLLDWAGLSPGQVLPQAKAFLEMPFSQPGIHVADEGYGAMARKTKMLDYEAMEYNSYIAKALDIYADEATQPAEKTEEVVWVKTDDKQVKEVLDELFERIDLEEIIHGLARSIAKFGEYFCFPVVEADEGVQDLIFLHPVTVEVVPDPITGKKAGYKCDALELMSQEVSSPNDSISNQNFPHNLLAKAKDTLAPWDLIHFRVSSSDLTTPYGHSLIEPARHTWRELSWIETAVIIYRVHTTGTKFIYNIDVGTSAPDEARSIVEHWKRVLTKNEVLTVTKASDGTPTGKYIQRFRPFAMLENIYWPKRKDSTSSIDHVSVPADINALEDVESFTNKLRTALGIPKAYFDQDISGWNANKALSQQDIQFGRQMVKLQRAIIRGITDLCTIHLIYKGHADAQFEIQMAPPSALLELQRLEVQSTRASIAAEMMGLAESLGLKRAEWARHVLETCLNMSKADIKRFMKPDEEIEDAEAIDKGLKPPHDVLIPGTPPQTVPGIQNASRGISPRELKTIVNEVKQRISAPLKFKLREDAHRSRYKTFLESLEDYVVDEEDAA